MHVLLISRSFPHHRPGGMEWHAQDLALGLMEAGHRVSVLTTPLPRKPALVPLSVNGRIVECGGEPGTYDAKFAFDLLMRGKRLVSAIAPDIIHAQGFAGIAARRYLGGTWPLVTTIHGTLWSETPLRGGATGNLLRWWRYKHRVLLAPWWREFILSGTRLITDSRFTIDEIEAECGPLKRPPDVVPLGFDLSRFPLHDGGRQYGRAQWRIDNDRILLASIGRLEPAKRPRLLLELFRRAGGDYPLATLVLAGEGSERGAIQGDPRNQALQKQQRIHLPGAVPLDRAASLLDAADLFLNADHGDPAFGLANAEALVMGTPVLAFDTGAHREVITDSLDGILVPRGDPGAFEKQLRAFLERLPEAPEARAERALRARSRFSRNAMIERLTNVYTDVVSAR